jgi:hypothetical protein
MNKDSSGGDRAGEVARSVVHVAINVPSLASTSSNASVVPLSNDVCMSSGSPAVSECKSGAAGGVAAAVGINGPTAPMTSLSHHTTTLTNHATSSMPMSAASSSSDLHVDAIFQSRPAGSTTNSSSSARRGDSVRESPVNSGNRARPSGFRSIFSSMARPSDPRAFMAEFVKPADVVPSHDPKEHRFFVKSMLQQLSAQSVKVLDNCVRCEIKRAVDAKLLVLFVFRSDVDCSAALQLLTAAKIPAHLAKARMSYLVLERVHRSVSVADAQQVFVSAGITVAEIVRPSDGSGVVLSKLCVGILSRDVGTFLASPVLASLSRGIMKATASKFSLPRKVCTECWSTGHSRRACACARDAVRCPICSEHHPKESCPLKDNPRSSRSRCPLCSQKHPAFDCSMFRGSLSPLLPAEQYAQQRGAAAPVPCPSLSDIAAFPPLPKAPTPVVQSAPPGWAAAQAHALTEKVANLEAKVQSLSDTCSTLKAQNSELITCFSQLSTSIAKLTERFDQLLVQQQEILPAIHAVLSRAHPKPSAGGPPTSPVPRGGPAKRKCPPTPVAPVVSKTSTQRSVNLSVSSLQSIAPPSAPTRSQFSSASAAAMSSASTPSDAIAEDSQCSK